MTDRFAQAVQTRLRMALTALLPQFVAAKFRASMKGRCR